MAESWKGKEITANIYNLGTSLVKFKLPIELVNSINKAYDENSKNLKPHNDQLAGKIADEKLVIDIITPEMKKVFVQCFQEYINFIHFTQKDVWELNPTNAVWINEMKSGEYNPVHYHTSSDSEVGLSSVLMLKRPDWYGVEASREEQPANGWLEFSGGDQAPLSQSQIRVNAQVGEFYVFPYSLLHNVYPFNSTGDEVRRTLSWNCDIIRYKGKEDGK